MKQYTLNEQTLIELLASANRAGANTCMTGLLTSIKALKESSVEFATKSVANINNGEPINESNNNTNGKQEVAGTEPINKPEHNESKQSNVEPVKPDSGIGSTNSDW